MVRSCICDLVKVHALGVASDGLIIIRGVRCAPSGVKLGVADSVCSGIKCIKAKAVIYS